MWYTLLCMLLELSYLKWAFNALLAQVHLHGRRSRGDVVQHAKPHFEGFPSIQPDPGKTTKHLLGLAAVILLQHILESVIHYTPLRSFPCSSIQQLSSTQVSWQRRHHKFLLSSSEESNCVRNPLHDTFWSREERGGGSAKPGGPRRLLSSFSLA